MTTNPTPVPLCIDAAGLAVMLNVSERQVHRMQAGGKLPEALAFGRCKRWNIEEVRAWMAAGSPPRERWIEMREAKK